MTFGRSLDSSYEGSRCQSPYYYFFLRAIWLTPGGKYALLLNISFITMTTLKQHPFTIHFIIDTGNIPFISITTPKQGIHSQYVSLLTQGQIVNSISFIFHVMYSVWSKIVEWAVSWPCGSQVREGYLRRQPSNKWLLGHFLYGKMAGRLPTTSSVEVSK